MEAQDSKPRVRCQSKAGGLQPPVADPELTLPVAQETTPHTPDEAPVDPNAKRVSHTIGGALRIDY